EGPPPTEKGTRRQGEGETRRRRLQIGVSSPGLPLSLSPCLRPLVRLSSMRLFVAPGLNPSPPLGTARRGECVRSAARPRARGSREEQVHTQYAAAKRTVRRTGENVVTQTRKGAKRRSPASDSWRASGIFAPLRLCVTCISSSPCLPLSLSP